MYRFTEKSITQGFRALDTSVAVASLALVLIVLNLPQNFRELGSFLEMRVTLKNALLVAAMTVSWPTVFGAFGLYRFGELRNVEVELTRIAKACVLGSAIAVGIALLSTSRAFGFVSVLLFAVTVTVGTACARAVVRWILTTLGAVQRIENIILVGTGAKARQHYWDLMFRPSQRVTGFMDTVAGPAPFGASGPPFLGTVAELEQILVRREVDAVHILLPVKSCYAAIAEVIATCERVGVESRYEADIFPRTLARVSSGNVGLVIAMKVVTDDYRLWIKRLMDVAGALLMLVLLCPVMLATAIMIWRSGAGPILFTQERFGFNRRRFKMYKFRTMVIDAEARQADLEHRNEVDGPAFKILDDPRITPVGRFLRKTSIDELPQLFNVLSGDMSLVGPRPLPVRDVFRFTEASLMRRFSVKPGLTCLWQINGRSTTNFDRWIQLDLEYIDRWSLGLDMAILVKTVPAVLRGSGAA